MTENFTPTVTDNSKAQLVRSLRDQAITASMNLEKIVQYALDLDLFEFSDDPRRLLAEARNIGNKVQELQRNLTDSVNRDMFTVSYSASALITL